jgi:hypothetical protein
MSSLDILAIVGERTKLIPTGGQFKAKCILPGHENERTPSFYVNPNQGPGVFFCHGCGRGGDVYTLMSILTGKPRKSFLEKRGTMTLAGLQGRIDALREKPAKGHRANQRAANLGWEALCSLFKSTDALLVSWKQNRYPRQRRYRGSLQHYLDRVEVAYQNEVGALHYRAGCGQDVTAEVMDCVRRAAREASAIVGVPVRPEMKGTL